MANSLGVRKLLVPSTAQALKLTSNKWSLLKIGHVYENFIGLSVVKRITICLPHAATGLVQ